MSAFDPVVVRALLRNRLPSGKHAEFDADWNQTVESKVTGWKKKIRKTMSSTTEQLEWEANIVKYVDYVHKLTAPSSSGKPASFLPSDVPLYGPHFLPPTYRDITARQKVPTIKPETAYLKPIYVIHPYYFPELSICPVCHSTNVTSQGWNTKGHRKVHGISQEEYAIGIQLECEAACKTAHNEALKRNQRRAKEDREIVPPICFATTNTVLWEDWEFWAIPRGVPIFFKRCGITRDLLDLIIECRPSTTSSGLAENIRQLHLLEHQKAHLDYLDTYWSKHGSFFDYKELHAFLDPFDKLLGGAPISDEIISEVFLEFSTRSRQSESESYMRTLFGICLSMDATFKVVNKAVVVDSKHKRSTAMRGGIMSLINEWTEILNWTMCQTQRNAEMTQILKGYARRCEELVVDLPEIVVVDNCCQFRSAILQSLPNAQIVLDTYHLMMRYLAAVVNGLRNPHRSAVAHDIVDAILKARATKSSPAEYWSKEEQETKLQEAYEKWVRKGTVWSAAAQKVHEDQLIHVKKGCLSRCRQDIRTDGSRIEGTNKHWNSIMRSHPSGVELFTALAHDFVHRRNMRIGYSARVEGQRPVTKRDAFLSSTHGSHHVHFTDHIAKQWNSLLAQVERKRKSNTELADMPRLPIVNSGERFGLVSSEHAKTFGGLLEDQVKRLKPDPPTKEELLEAPVDLVELAERDDPDEYEPRSAAILRSMHIDPALRLVPQGDAPITLQSSASTPVRASDGQDKAGEPDPEVCDLTGDSSFDVAPTQPVDTRQPIDLTTTPSSRAPSSTPPDAHSTSSPNVHSPAQETANATPSLLKRKRPESDKPAQDEERSANGGGGGDAQVERQAKRPRLPAKDKNVKVVTTIKAKIPVPGGGSKIGPRIDAFFQPYKPPSRAAATLPAAAVQAPSEEDSTSTVHDGSAAPPPADRVSALARSRGKEVAVCPIPIPELEGLTRSERFRSVLTGIHAHSMRIEGDIEFFLLTDMRLELKWVTFTMTSHMWVQATADYNKRLRAKNDEKGLRTIMKHPDALISRLSQLEKAIKKRIEANDYKSHKTGLPSEFWEKQCAIVALSAPTMKARKVQTCTRCKTVKYPGPTGSPENHKLKCCSDGVRISDDKDMPPPWPQPSGIYKDGTHFNAAAFLDTVRDVYERIIIDGQNALDLPTELINFALTLDARLVKVHTEERILFKLWQGLEIDGPPLDDRITYVAGHRFLVIDPLVLVTGAAAGTLAAATRACANARIAGMGAGVGVGATSAGVGMADAGASTSTGAGSITSAGMGETGMVSSTAATGMPSAWASTTIAGIIAGMGTTSTGTSSVGGVTTSGAGMWATGAGTGAGAGVSADIGATGAGTTNAHMGATSAETSAGTGASIDIRK